jgi:glycosyltransferase involved in cell wall biosynthesis
VLDGIKRLIKSGLSIRLHVIGCDDSAEEAKWVAQAGVTGAVEFLGVLGHEQALQCIAGSSALLLPSRNDTFGMVYVEALLSGVPVLYSANAGIDGYLDRMSVGVRVDPASHDSIVRGMLELTMNLDVYRQHLRSCLMGNRLDFFRRESIAAKYIQVIRAVGMEAGKSVDGRVESA